MDVLNYTDIKGCCCRIMWKHSRDSPPQKSGANDGNIFIKNLDTNIDNKVLFDTFSIFGSILSCKVATDRDGTSRGYGFVQYESGDAAKQAIERVNGMLIEGRKVFVGPFIKKDQRDMTVSFEEPGGSTGASLYVRNIPWDWDDIKVSELFRPFGELASTFVMNDAKTQKRYGFVNYKDEEHAKTAIEALHGKDMRTE